MQLVYDVRVAYQDSIQQANVIYVYTRQSQTTSICQRPFDGLVLEMASANSVDMRKWRLPLHASILTVIVNVDDNNK